VRGAVVVGGSRGDVGRKAAVGVGEGVARVGDGRERRMREGGERLIGGNSDRGGRDEKN